ncbi:MAG TPA: Gfo/Idh/MocA family oxidoreductase [Verrucomicrobiae bacterium]|nr:Gfo/Idh/MocA family oxidoreductase [Verrucomicrobiae bacterium]
MQSKQPAQPVGGAGGVTRRQSLKAAASFLILPAGLARGYAANEKLNLGIVGLTGMGGVDAKTFSGLGENIAALCDVDTKILDKRGAEYPSARKYTDFRQMIEKEKLDGIGVAVPDHNHAYISVYAMRHGLNVYCQKPLCKSVHEARIMARVAAETKVVTQMGTQTSAEPTVLRTVELIQSGAIGEITEIHMTTDRPIWPQGYDRPEGEDVVPDTLDWDLWLGTAPRRPFRGRWPEGHAVFSPEKKRQFAANGTVYHPFSWRGWWDFGSGALGDIAPHSMNVIFLALDLGAPQAVEIVDTSGMKKEMFPDWTTLCFKWPARGVHPALSVYWYDGGQPLPAELQAPGSGAPPAPGEPLRAGQGGTVWIGTKGSYPAGRGPFAGKNAETPPPPEREWGREEVHKDWVMAVKAGKPAPCHFGYAGPFTEAYQLGNIALRIGHRIEWDALDFRIVNCAEANQYLIREYRRGWDLKEIAGRAWDVRRPEAVRKP